MWWKILKCFWILDATKQGLRKKKLTSKNVTHLSNYPNHVRPRGDQTGSLSLTAKHIHGLHFFVKADDAVGLTVDQCAWEAVLQCPGEWERRSWSTFLWAILTENVRRFPRCMPAIIRRNNRRPSMEPCAACLHVMNLMIDASCDMFFSNSNHHAWVTGCNQNHTVVKTPSSRDYRKRNFLFRFSGKPCHCRSIS